MKRAAPAPTTKRASKRSDGDDASPDTRELLNHAPLGATLDFLRHIWAVHHGVQSRSKRMETVLGITGPQRLVMRVVGRFPGVSAGELARIMHFHPSTLTGILQRLDERGYVVRAADDADRRRMLLSLTAKGRAAISNVNGTVEGAAEATLRAFSRAEIAAASAVLRAFAFALGTEGPEE
jgi:DNA-binding MarR family transcriptional regulator